jgi:hypothetical protein
VGGHCRFKREKTLLLVVLTFAVQLLAAFGALSCSLKLVLPALPSCKDQNNQEKASELLSSRRSGDGNFLKIFSIT